MEFSNVFFMGTALLLIVALVHVSQAQNLPQDYLDAHNKARTEVGIGLLSWNDAVAAYAQNYANQRSVDCGLVVSNGPYGENLANKIPGPLPAADAVNLWICEKKDYDHNTNSCTSNVNTCTSNGPAACLSYTQVVWKNTTRLGCGSAPCNNGGTIVVCSYDPQGNIPGQSPY